MRGTEARVLCQLCEGGYPLRLLDQSAGGHDGGSLLLDQRGLMRFAMLARPEARLLGVPAGRMETHMLRFLPSHSLPLLWGRVPLTGTMPRLRLLFVCDTPLRTIRIRRQETECVERCRELSLREERRICFSWRNQSALGGVSYVHRSRKQSHRRPLVHRVLGENLRSHHRRRPRRSRHAVAVF